MSGSGPSALADSASEVEALAREAGLAPDDAGLLERLRQAMATADAARGSTPDSGAPGLDRAGSAAFHHGLAAFYRRHLRLDAAIEACRAGVAADPHDIGLRRLWLESLLSARRLEEAGPVLDVPAEAAGVAGEAAVVSFLFRADKLLARAGRADLALAALERVTAIQPLSPQLEVRLLSRAEESGRPDLVAAYRSRLRERLTGRLPRRLGDGLAALWSMPAEHPLPAAAVAWAWSLADKKAWSQKAWRAELDWASRSRQLLREWWTVSPDRGAIDELVDAPDLTELRALQIEGATQVVAGAHCGPTWAAVQVFQACGLGFRAMGAIGLDQLQGAPPTVIALKDNATATVRELLGEMRKGVLLGMLADSAAPGDRVVTDFLGRRVELSSLPARLAQRYGCPSWWCQPLWRGDRIVIELERLPDPDPEEPEADWVQRWCRAYLGRLEPVMRGDPRNLDLTKGIWRAAR